tara:strand:- start:41 stop:751 length:711 start_codon:yes stop_codon:yes gene_type:complete
MQKKTIPIKNEVLVKLFGESLRSKIVAIFLSNKEYSSSEITKRVNGFGKLYDITSIREHLTQLKKDEFIVSNRDGNNIAWKINLKNKFLTNFVQLMRSPKGEYSEFNEYSEVVEQYQSGLISPEDFQHKIMSEIQENFSRFEGMLNLFKPKYSISIERKTEEERIIEIKSAIYSKVNQKNPYFKPKDILSQINGISPQRLSQILGKLANEKDGVIQKDQNKKGYYFVTMNGFKESL